MPTNFMGQNVGFAAPDADQQLEIQRRLAMSQMLQQQGMEPIQEQKVPGGWAVPIHPLQGAAKLAQSYVGAKAGGRAQELAKQLQGDQQARRGADIGMLVQALQGRPAQPAGLAEDAAGNVTPTDPLAAQTPSQGLQQALPMMQDPAMQQFGLAQYASQIQRDQAAPERVDLGDRIGLMKNGVIVGYLPKGITPDTSLRERGAEDRHDRPSGSAALSAQTALRGQDIGVLTAAAGRATTERGQDISARGGKPLTEFQGRNVLFGTRMAQSDKTLRELEDKISTTGLAVKQGAQNVPIIGGILGAAGNVALSKNQQRVEQAQRDFVNAVLRQESGAVINPDEFDNAKKQYFPQPGDNKEVIEQKRRNRQIAIDAFKFLAGPGGSQIDQLLATPKLPAEGNTDIDELLRLYGGP